MSALHKKIIIKPLGVFKRTSPPVFLTSASIIVLLILFGTLFTGTAETFFNALQKEITASFSWLFTIATLFFLLFALFLIFSPYGKIRLGQADDRPEFSTFTWFAMLFSAGMGIGLVFWSIAEPISHFIARPSGQENISAAALEAMKITYFHWGLHAWAVFMVVGVSLAFFSFRRNLPFSLRSAFYPLFGEKIFGPIGHAIDIFAVVGTLFGVATSLGLGAMQVNSGLNFIAGVPQSVTVQLLLIAGITAIATVSVVLGLHKGISRLSLFNLWLAGGLMLFVLTAGPTSYILGNFFESSAAYLGNLAQLSYWSEWETDLKWKSSWTIFYWAWWVAWAPFVGTFIARISRGRTIRELLVAGLFAPALTTFVWLSVFGGTALHLEIFAGASIAEAVSFDVSSALFKTLNQLPYSLISSSLATLAIVTFFVTSSDSGSLVIDMITAGGDANPPVNQRVFWAITEGAAAAVLLIAGGLQSLQTAAIASGFPLALLLVGMCFCLLKALRQDSAQG